MEADTERLSCTFWGHKEREREREREWGIVHAQTQIHNRTDTQSHAQFLFVCLVLGFRFLVFRLFEFDHCLFGLGGGRGGNCCFGLVLFTNLPRGASGADCPQRDWPTAPCNAPPTPRWPPQRRADATGAWPLPARRPDRRGGRDGRTRAPPECACSARPFRGCTISPAIGGWGPSVQAAPGNPSATDYDDVGVVQREWCSCGGVVRLHTHIFGWLVVGGFIVV